MKIATTKERILQVLEIKDVSRPLFLEKTGIKRGFLDSDKLNQAVSDINIAKFIAIFPDINIKWLITGNGDMFISQTEPHTHNCQLCSEKDKRINELKETIDLLKEHIDTLKRQ
jgi:hypothetical protein